ncbi:tRNA (guanosine(46)-N7)-methyltransferase TrmB [Gorillibacterium massiliense]|uniref:tRNA (guanosine(46)-N7)-methyltransferase TrmB n=1 Tax=Gorillibacterium massiliense TaxID=1280390 RepID=UPI0004AD22AD|nr:tRNA (guanosine(46)-N7)-methyltransferase TrmB [Gorillibacterium massiliense]
MRLRGRKGIREELERQTDLVVLDPRKLKGKWREHFGNDLPIHVELGMGKGIFISEWSRRNPNVNYIGVDRYDELIRRGALKARRLHHGGQVDELEDAVDGSDIDSVVSGPAEVGTEAVAAKPWNLALALLDIQYIDEVFAPGEVERVYLNFSDPWPKSKHARRRLTHPGFVRKYLNFLNERGEIHLKTDSRLLFEYSLNSFSDMGLRMRNISLDLHANGIRDDLVLTEYESKFVAQGMNIHRCEVVTGKDALADHLAALEANKHG